MKKEFFILLLLLGFSKASADTCAQMITAPNTPLFTQELMKLRCDYNTRIQEGESSHEDVIDELDKINTEEDKNIEQNYRRLSELAAERRARLKDLIIKRDILSGIISHTSRRAQPEAEFQVALREYIKTLATPSVDAPESQIEYVTRLLVTSKARESAEKLSVFLEDFLDDNSIENPQDMNTFLKKRHYIGAPIRMSDKVTVKKEPSKEAESTPKPPAPKVSTDTETDKAKVAN
jgi:hypothetical protein